MKQLNFPTFVDRPKWQHIPAAAWWFVRLMRHPEYWRWGGVSVAWSVAWRFRKVRLRVG